MDLETWSRPYIRLLSEMKYILVQGNLFPFLIIDPEPTPEELPETTSTEETDSYHNQVKAFNYLYVFCLFTLYHYIVLFTNTSAYYRF